MTFKSLDEVSGRIESVVTTADTAAAVGSGDVPVLATPRVLALVEAATISALTLRVPTALTALGTKVELHHRAPVPVGRKVIAEAKLNAIDQNRLNFTVRIIDAEDRLIADGELERVICDREQFMAKVNGTETSKR